ncbi:MAG TPA: VWA domain-containing protein [Pirellulales bacterium]|nr:VWA domain-containing protein [Pirellulales bacterium]
MRACNLGQIVGRCGHILVDSSPAVRACLASGAGHAAALITMAMVVGGGGLRDTIRSQPALTVSASDELAAIEPELLTQASPETSDRRIESPADPDEVAAEPQAENPAIAEWLSRNMASPADLSNGKAGSKLAGTLAQVATEIDEKGTEARGRLGRGASFYGVEAEGRKFVFVVDISGSMSGSRFRRARAELYQSIEKLHPDQSFYVVLFNSGATLMPSLGMAAASPANVQSVADWLKTVHCGGETNPAPALTVALAMKPDAVYLLSDGKFDPALAQTVSQFQIFQRIPVHTIGFASRKGEPMLKAISQVSGGTYRYVR